MARPNRRTVYSLRRTAGPHQSTPTLLTVDVLRETCVNAVPPPEAMLRRPARALIGWMSPEQGVSVLAGNRLATAPTAQDAERVAAARQTVASRAPGVDQTNLVKEPPGELDEHSTALQAAQQAMFSAGWRINIIDLQRVCALQPVVHSEHAEERVRDVDPTDIRSIASITLPLPKPTPLPAQYDPLKQAWILSAANPNLRIVGNFSGEVQPGVTGIGFLVRVLPSFVQVAEFRGRYLLHDGYHRAFGLLRRGITAVPAFVRTFTTFEEMGINPGMLPLDAYLGERPPLLTDYADDDVAATVQLPAVQKMIVIHGLEITPTAGVTSGDPSSHAGG